MKLSFLKKAIISGLLTVGVVAGSLAAAAVPAAASNPASMTITPATQSVANGATGFSVSIVASTTVATRGWGANVLYDGTKLQEVSVTYGGFFSSTYGTPFNITPSVVGAGTSTAEITGLAQTFLGGTGGPTGSGTLATIVFNCIDNNTAASVTLDPTVSGSSGPVSSLVDVNANTIATTLNNGVIIQGTVPEPDLTVTNLSTAIVHSGTSASTDPTTYTVSFNVKNIGTANAGTSTAWVVVDGGTPISESVAALNAGVTSSLITTSPITLANGSDSIVVTADATSQVAGNLRSSPSASTSFSFVYAVGQTTDVNGSIVGTLSFTQPATIAMGNMAIGPNSQSSTMNVISNQAWTVTVVGEAPTVTADPNANVDAGKMTKLTGTSYNPYIKLTDQFNVTTSGGYLTPFQTGPSTYLTPSNADVALTGTAQTLATGISQGQVTNSAGTASLGESRNLTYSQVILASDPSLASPSIYDINVGFVASATGY